jgi:thiamine biosynthesis protein ThiC
MSYQDELQAKLDAVRTLGEFDHGKKVDTNILEEQLVNELQDEFEFSQYDLDESDLIRSIKILDILQSYQEVFSQTNALRVFYALSKTDVIQAKNLFTLSELKSKDFKHLISTMAKHTLLNITKDKELELTMQGQSLSERIGFDVFL